MRNEITFKNGRRVFTDADITPKVITKRQEQFESEVIEVNRKPLSKHSVLKAKAGTKTHSKPKKTNPNAISWETFEEKYNPQINHILKEKYPKDDPTGLTGWGGIMYETYGDEYEYIREMAQKHPNRVWTLVDGDDGELVIIAGWHYVNRMNYVVTEKPWNTGDEYVDDEMAKHGAKINYIKKWSVSYIDMYKKSKKIVVELGRMSNKDDVQQALKRRGDVMEVLSISELYKYGSMVPDNHEWVELENLYTNFESEQQLWEIWSLKQRYHFLKDHFRVELSKAKDQTELQKFEWQMEDTARLDYDNLPTLVKMELKNHKFSGQYKTGGPVKLNVTIELITDKDEPEHLQYGVFDYKGELIEPGFEDINQATTWANEQGYNTDKKAKRGAMIDESQTDLFDKSGVKYRAEVGGIGENRWSGNAMEYDTEDEAKDWLRGLASRWYGYNISRVVPVSVPTNQNIDLSDPLMFQNYRKNAKGTKIRTNSEEHSEKNPMIDIGSDNIAKRGAKTQGVEWDKDSDSIRTQLGEFRVTITPQMQKGYYDVYVSANKKQIGKKYDVYGLENAKDIAFSMISNANKVAEGDMVGSDNTRYPRKADDTGKGIMEGWVIGDGNAYYEKEENALKSVKELGYKTIEEAYDNDEIYFTDWHDEDLDEQGYYYTANGKEVQISSKGSKLGGMERENAEMVLNNNKQISHHTEELASAIKGKSVPAWVVAKVNRSATDLSDATHYLEGTEKAMRGTKIRKSGFVIKYLDENGTEQVRMSRYAGIPEIFKTESSANFTIKRVPAFKIGKFTNPRVVPYLAKAEHGAKTSKGFMVFNYTDDIYASPDTFPTKAKANEFIAQFRKRFEGQGYYRDNRMNKVAPKDIDLLAIPEEFNPYKKN